MRYLIFCEDGGIFQTDSITQYELDAFLSGLIDIVDTKNTTVYCDDLSWKPVHKWNL